MKEYLRLVPTERMQCITCNASVAETLAGEFVCVDCGRSPIGGG